MLSQRNAQPRIRQTLDRNFLSAVNRRGTGRARLSHLNIVTAFQEPTVARRPLHPGLRGFDMTQGEFAERIGISQNYLSVMERGKVEIGAEILLRIGREFVKSVEWLLTGEE